MTTDLDAAIAAEEHQQGRPYIAGQHCERCADVDRAWGEAARIQKRRTCKHENVETIDLPAALCGDPWESIRQCRECGGVVERWVELTG